jgi:hypothetical protein
VFVNVYKAGAADFKWGALGDNVYTPTSGPDEFHEQDGIIVLESCPRDIFKQDFPFFQEDMKEYSHHGLVMGEDYNHLHQILDRWHPYATTTAGAAIQTFEPNLFLTYGLRLGIEAYSAMFLFWRGSIKIRYCTKTTTPESFIVRNGAAILAGTGVSCGSTTNPFMDITFPYYSNNLYESTNVTGTVWTYQGSTNASNYFVCKSAGEDFSTHFLHLPKGNYSNTTTANNQVGAYGLLNFYST